MAPQGLRTELTLLIACVVPGTGGNIDVVVYHDDDGTTYDNDSVIFTVQRATTGDDLVAKLESIGGGIFVKPGGSIGVEVSSANTVNFSLYGITETLAQERIRPR